MNPHAIRLPNGHRSHSRLIDRVRVFPARSRGLIFLYVQIFENGAMVYEGLIDLTDPEIAGVETVLTADLAATGT